MGKQAFEKSWNGNFIVKLQCDDCGKETTFTVEERKVSHLVCPGCYETGNFSLALVV